MTDQKEIREGRPCVICPCVICKTGTLEKGAETVMLERGEATIVIKQVPGLICTTCGEGYFSEEVADRLLHLVEEAASAGVEVDVRRYTPGEELERAA